jgi:hypothetical protein
MKEPPAVRSVSEIQVLAVDMVTAACSTRLATRFLDGTLKIRCVYDASLWVTINTMPVMSDVESIQDVQELDSLSVISGTALSIHQTSRDYEDINTRGPGEHTLAVATRTLL